MASDKRPDRLGDLRPWRMGKSEDAQESGSSIDQLRKALREALGGRGMGFLDLVLKVAKAVLPKGPAARGDRAEDPNPEDDAKLSPAQIRALREQKRYGAQDLGVCYACGVGIDRAASDFGNLGRPKHPQENRP
eukprot:Skav215365  [mRNA]  locus=scaffold1391:643249:645251:- [translate_table: standard]